MSIESTHPQYDQSAPRIQKMRDFYAGSDQVKSQGETYLPAPRSIAMLKEDPRRSGRFLEAYEAYKSRAEVPEYVSDAIDKNVGIMHASPPSIELPDALSGMLDDATGDGLGLADLLRNINAEQLFSGRLGLALDARTGIDYPVIRMYFAEDVRNWLFSDGQYQFVILGEQEESISEYEWKIVPSRRVMEVIDGAYATTAFDNKGAIIRDQIQPEIRGKRLDIVPFVAINAADTAPDIDKPPLLPLAEKCASIYRLDADHKLNLHMQSASTLVIAGLAHNGDQHDGDGERKVMVGAGGFIEVDIGGSAEYAQPGAEGLTAQQQALDAMHIQAKNLGVDILGNAGAGESGDAMNVRLIARTATLVQVASAGAAGLERILKIAARWVGANPDQVAVKPFTDFNVQSANPAEALALAQIRNLGAPYSKRAYHWWLSKQKFTPFSYEEEMDEIENEGP